ncbi:LytTR family DNA-binding domain-containing protein [Niabella sp. CC-SYL272]|uniref:LytR/AlgR family response regulator transcription factor n=1 Tax=Niabella agricola TaxID=2891571 RepID=UPI001F20BEAA|nr:LytTR family DNA-binding domain-containing protein [Niabella agricola]MCF3111516.1 LytTR family DNA-binding domain-containing protein [Niabella agricola]
MKVLIIEDEELAVKKLEKTLIAVDPSIEVMGVADSIKSAVDWLESNPDPDLILMDIELSDGQSFEIFNLTAIKVPVIFTTSYDEFALKAFKVNSVDYLLKPVQKDELKKALEKFRQNFSKQREPLGFEHLVKELQQKLQLKEYRKRFLVKSGSRLVSVDIDEIAYFYSDGRLIFFKTKDQRKFIVDYTMEDLESMLNPEQFFRISRSFFISIGCIEKIDDYFGNRLILQLNPPIDKDALVSRERVTDFKVWMGK